MVLCAQDNSTIRSIHWTCALSSFAIFLPTVTAWNKKKNNFHCEHYFPWVHPPPPSKICPGSSTGDVNYQAYLIEGIVRWNTTRAVATNPDKETETVRTFDVCLKERVWLVLSSDWYHFIYHYPTDQQTEHLNIWHSHSRATTCHQSSLVSS